MHLSMGNSLLIKSSQDMDIMERTHAKAKLWLVNNRDEPIMGEGKSSLLEAIGEEGSLNKAAKK